MKAQIVLIAVLAALVQLDAALISKPSGGLFGGVFGKKQADFNADATDAEVINEASSGNLLQNAFGKIKETSDNVKSTVTEKIAEGQATIVSANEKLSEQIENAKEAASNAVEKVQGEVAGNVEKVQGSLAGAVEKAQESISGTVGKAQEQIQNVQEGVAEKVEGAQGMWKNVAGKIANKAQSDIALVKGTAEGAIGKAKDAIEAVMPENFWMRLWNFLTGIFRPGAKQVVATADKVAAAVSETIESGAATLEVSEGAALPVVQQPGILEPPTVAAA